MLVIAIVAMGSQSDPLAVASPHPAPSKARPSPSRTPPKPTPSPSRSPSPTPKPVGPPSLEQTPVIIEVHAAAGDTAALTSQLDAALAPYRGRHAGIVETFGWGSDPGADTAYATEVNGLLNRVAPALFPAGTPEEDYIDLGSPTGGAKIKIYLFTASS
jgi:hypothetical protein